MNKLTNEEKIASAIDNLRAIRDDLISCLEYGGYHTENGHLIWTAVSELGTLIRVLEK